MTLRIITQRQWHYAGRWLSLRVVKSRRRLFLSRWDRFWGVLEPVSSFTYWIQHPRTWLKVQHYKRLIRAGRTEISL